MSQPQARHLVEEEEEGEAAKLAGHARWLVQEKAQAGQMVAPGGRELGRAQVKASSTTNRPSEPQSSKRHPSHFNTVSVKPCQYPANHRRKHFSSDDRGVEGKLAPENIAV